MQVLEGKTCCVIGGGGFLGQHIVRELLRKECNVIIFDLRCNYTDERVKILTGDLCKKQDLVSALTGVDIVFHCATPSPLSNNRDLFLKVNYVGTEKIIEVCKEVGVKYLVLTSSASVVYEGKDLKAATEETPYAQAPMDYYTETKILQEKVVLEADSDELATTAIRPHGIFGPHDPHLVPTTIKMAKKGKTKFMIGDGNNLVDFTFVENVVHGHILAAEALCSGKPVNGKAYHITNDEPIYFWAFLAKIITGLGYDAPKYHLPFSLIFVLAVILNFICIAIRPLIDIRPTFTPMTVCLAGTHHYYSCERAKKDMGYKPLVSLEKGIANTLATFEYLKKGYSEES